MGTSYITYLPEQQYLMPCALQEWLPEGHLVAGMKIKVVASDVIQTSHSVTTCGIN
jgi:hypothetical protein